MDTKYFGVPFASSGDKTSVPDPAPGDGSVSYASGFGIDYELDPGTNPAALDVPRRQFNQIEFDITSSLGRLQQFFAPQWITSTDNDGSPFGYAAGALVLYTDNNVYQSLVAANTATPGTDPTKWIVFLSNYATAAALAAETARALAAEALLAPKANPTFSGNVNVGTRSPGDSSVNAASTAFVTGAVATLNAALTAALALKAPSASPTLTGTPLAPTASALTNNTQIATTAYADGAVAAINASLSAAIAAETAARIAADNLLAPKNSPTLTGVPLAPTAAPGTNTTQIATTAFVQSKAPFSTLINMGAPTPATTPDAAHGLGSNPALTGGYEAFLVNTVAEFGFNPGDSVQLTVGGTSRNDGGQAGANASNGYVLIGNNGCYVIQAGVAHQITVAHWNLYWRGWVFN